MNGKQILDPKGLPLAPAKKTKQEPVFGHRTTFLEFANPKADWIIAGPNEEFLHSIWKAFQIDALYVRYGTRVEHKKFKRIIVFGAKGMGKDLAKNFQEWQYYLSTRLESMDKEDMIVI